MDIKLVLINLFEPSLRCQAHLQLTHFSTHTKSCKRTCQPIPPGLLICTQNEDLYKGTD
jgi:hypothetical protein